MMLIRPAKYADFERLIQFSLMLKDSGLTTLPANSQTLEKNLNKSIQSFKQQKGNFFWFVMEDSVQKKIVGCSAIMTHIGLNEPFYSYKLGKITQRCHALNIVKHHQLLHLVNDYHDVTEVGTLFLIPTYRRNQNGKLLSKSRFAFMAQFPHLFNSTVVADIRGSLDKSGHSPFWGSLGQYFFGMNFTRADYLSAITNKQFIADLVPTYPIYTCLLSSEAQQVIGIAHETSQRAKSILEDEGFKFNQYVDIFDAGPTLEAAFNEIQSIKNSTLKTVTAIEFLDHDAINMMVANTKLNEFKLSLGAVKATSDSDVTITPELAQILEISIGDNVRLNNL